MELELTLDNFDAEIGKSTPILVDFWAAWCGPCRMLAPVLESLSDRDDFKIVKVDVRTKATEAIASARLMLTNSRNLQSVSVLQAFRR